MRSVVRKLAAHLLVIVLLPLVVVAFAWWFFDDWRHGRKIGAI